MTLYWLSFADGELPPGSQFLGACIVPGLSFMDAVMKTHMCGINPGGEVQGHEIPAENHRFLSKDEFCVLMNREQCEALGARVEAAQTAELN